MFQLIIKLEQTFSRCYLNTLTSIAIFLQILKLNWTGWNKLSIARTAFKCLKKRIIVKTANASYTDHASLLFEAFRASDVNYRCGYRWLTSQKIFIKESGIINVLSNLQRNKVKRKSRHIGIHACPCLQNLLWCTSDNEASSKLKILILFF